MTYFRWRICVYVYVCEYAISRTSWVKVSSRPNVCVCVCVCVWQDEGKDGVNLLLFASRSRPLPLPSWLYAGSVKALSSLCLVSVKALWRLCEDSLWRLREGFVKALLRLCEGDALWKCKRKCAWYLRISDTSICERPGKEPRQGSFTVRQCFLAVVYFVV